MEKYKIILSVIVVFFLWLALWYGLVFAWPLTKWESFHLLSKNIFLDSKELSSNILILESYDNPKDFSFVSDCSASWKYLKSDWYKHFFEVKVSDKTCKKEKIDFYLKNSYKTIKTTFNLLSDYSFLNKYLDYPTKDLEKIKDSIQEKILNSKNITSPEEKRTILELKYLEEKFLDILEKQNQKYLIPVKWAILPKRETKVPNSRRPYRNSYTDWIHHWWDFDAKKLTPVLSIDDWIIIRVVRWFSPSDFWKIQRDWKISEEVKLKNLDVLRWNQVWVKTMKWDVAFYSHLEEIFPEIKEWTLVKRWQPMWVIWATWVPEEWYSDFHLHMAIHKNPKNLQMAWKYEFIDIMAWPWYFKWQKSSYVLEHQKEVFEEK